MKTLKSILAGLTLLVVVGNGTAQAKLTGLSGLYSTANDFQQQKLTYPIDGKVATGKIKPNDLLGSTTGYVEYNGKTFAFDKTKVYGYRDDDNKNYRFYNHSIYQIIDTAGFYIYYQYRSVEQTKGKGLVKMDLYFFSKKADGEILPLTTENLKDAYPDNTKFHYALDTNFPSDKGLLAYDKYQNTYKLKYLYNQSLK
jgi:hypothetical protein